ncbi:protein kinase domain-containing protein [Peribacillus deserti]|uniref:Serine/threonine protein kinase n=1 Tax=Peribacillus deserti TaxID=673318 RepID=A0A2N5M942_9BACI|nr:serine/threonine-protein kinase [Peribacillus deserti]PLT30867.1 serine/threonine protein kinase [Peribacillus deserti]
MMNNSLRSQCKALPGTIIKGKWYKNEYKVIKELGFGANGIVYLAEFGGQEVALKVSDNSMSISSEMNILKSFTKVQGSALGPSLLSVDDWVNQGVTLPFYVMEYIKGETYLDFLRYKGTSWSVVLILQLLKNLSLLHQSGWIFGDLKPENLIISSPSCQIRCVDVGGTTIKGRSIKEFTEFFDRGYWGLGSRKAEPSYDLFAVAMIFLNSYYPNRFTKKTDGYSQLSQAIKGKKELKVYEQVLEKALLGKYSTAMEMRNELLAAANQNADRISRQQPSPSRNMRQTQSRSRRKQKKGGLLESLLLVVLISFIYLLYIYTKLL